MIKSINKTGQSILSIFKVIWISKWRGILKKKTKQTGKCIIVGNGPSFKQSISKYKQEIIDSDTICVNSFATSELYKEIKPNFYIISAAVYFKPDAKISGLYINLRNETFDALAVNTEWNLELLVPFIAKKSTHFQELLKKNTNITVLYYNLTGVEGFEGISHFLFKRKLGMPRPHNVLIPAIMNVVHLGYSDIRIIGADHSWLPEITVTEKNEALINLKHFYDEGKSKPAKMQDFIIRPRRLHEIIHKIYLSFKGYWEIKSYVDKINVNVYNSSEFSMIDAFERKPLD